MNNTDTIIIGSGVAGLSAAIRLSAAGHKVKVFEANAYPGGKLSEFMQDGFRFDAGPSLFTLPYLIEDLIRLSGKKPEEIFSYIQPEEICSYFYEDGTRFTAFRDKDKLAREIRTKLNTDPQSFFSFLEKAKTRYTKTAPLFIERSLHRFNTYLSKDFITGLTAIPQLNLLDTMYDEIESHFSSPYLRSYFSRYATYNGSDPYQAPALLNMIPHLEHETGSYFPVNGMHQITQVLYESARHLGVEFIFNSRVTEITTAKNKVTGVKTATGYYPSNVVLSNMDVYHTYTMLLPELSPPEKQISQEKSSSAVIFYWGIGSEFKELGLHNIFFTNNYKHEFSSLFKEGKVSSDPTVYINITSKHKKSDAPEGCENWFVLVNTPATTAGFNPAMTKEIRSNTIQKLSRMLNTDIESHILTESVLTPFDIEIKTSSFGGSLYGNSSNNRFAAFLRHANFSSKVKGLYFCGGSVHPGGGIPLSINSGKIAAGLILGKY